MSETRELLLSEEQQMRFATHLVNEGLFGVKEDPADYIKLKSERLSPHYLDMRPGIASFHTRVKIVGGSMLALAEARAIQWTGNQESSVQDVYDKLVGTPEAFTTYAATIADLAETGVLQPRVDTMKATGNKTPILGRYTPNSKVGVFDDVVTDGASKITTVKALADANLEVLDYFVALDREEGGAPQVHEATGLEIVPALGLSRMVTMLHEGGALNQRQFDNVCRYMEQYGEPHAQEQLAA